ncbi:hypothetical protein [Nocardioides sp. LHG3406-4]|uniref:hypothetical protein n=1 Tax=Nocardioides sp. LHG3406-4 TaxID=2804575 RepID=UPI003CFB5239
MARWAVLGLAAVVVFTAIGFLIDRGVELIPSSESCTATVQGRSVELSVEQAENAALISAIAVQRGMPARAATIALATAYQESDLRNIEHGDRDSVGLFQQRPSQGWGTGAQILNPYYSINAFYDGLMDIDGYDSMRVTEAAQAVQRSGFPEAYADHEGDARVLASALTGNSPRAFSCTIDEADEAGSSQLNDEGLTRRAARVRKDLVAAFGEQSMGGFDPGGVSAGHMAGSAHYEGRAIDVFVRPVSPDNRKRGWAMAAYLTAQASRLDIDTVIFDDRIWHAGSRSDDGWTDYDVPSSSRGDRAILEHRDHVHVDVHD